MPRSAKALDVGRAAAALARPGIDTRTWKCLAFVTDYNVDEEGPFVDVLLMPDRVPETARVASNYSGVGFGFYTPLEVDDEVIVGYPCGNANEGLVVLGRMWSASDPPPPDAITAPEDLHLHVKDGTNLNLTVSGGGQIRLGSSGATENFILGQQWKAFMTTVLTAIAAITVPTGVGPSGIPINSQDFLDEISDLDDKLSDVIFGEKG